MIERRNFQKGVTLAAAGVASPRLMAEGTTLAAPSMEKGLSKPGKLQVVEHDVDLCVVNLGFSGSGKMELEMSEHLAGIDASCYVLDCLWNMTDGLVEARFKPFVLNLRTKRPGVPIVFAEACDVWCGSASKKDRFIRCVYDRLTAEDWKDLFYQPKTDMYSGDTEGTVDGCHPNDLGMMTMAKAFGVAVRKELKLK